MELGAREPFIGPLLLTGPPDDSAGAAFKSEFRRKPFPIASIQLDYCKVHPTPKPDEVFNGNCKDCYADYEVKFFTDSNYYKRLI